MSFILDALRKSEGERQQDAGPNITRIPAAVPRHGLPGWAIGTMAALGLGVVVLAGAWITTLTGPGPGPVASSPAGGGAGRPDETQPAESDGRARERESYAARDGLPTEGEPFGSAARVEPLSLPPPRTTTFSGSVATEGRAASSLGDLGGTSSLAAAAGAGSREAAPLTTVQPRTTARQALPSVEAMPASYHSVAPSLGLPELTLELLANSEDPARRFVFINGSRYAVGDTLPEGAQVIAINARGAVLLVQGRQLQLEQR